MNDRALRRAEARHRRMRARLLWNAWTSPTSAMDRAYARMLANARLRQRRQIIDHRWPRASAVKREYRRRRR